MLALCIADATQSDENTAWEEAGDVKAQCLKVMQRTQMPPAAVALVQQVRSVSRLASFNRDLPT
jgi:hypothetical protein